MNLRKKRPQSSELPSDQLLPKITLWFFDRRRFTALLFLLIFVFGIFSYTTLLRREGFPGIAFPIAIVNGTYAVNDPTQVDAAVTKPIVDAALRLDGAVSVSSQSYGNFFTIGVQFEEGTNADASIEQLKKDMSETLPSQAQVSYQVPYFGATGPSAQPIDVAVSFYARETGIETREIVAEAETFADKLRQENLSQVADVFVVDPFRDAINPATGQSVAVQQTFDRFGERESEQTDFFNSVIIGVTGVSEADIIELDEQVSEAVARISSEQNNGYDATVSAGFAEAIEDNINELQRVLLEAFIAILVVGSIVIAVRASIITVISLLSVLAATLGLLFLLGYTLNVITLFALILSLSLIVDDTIIMIEAIDAQRRKTKDRRVAVRIATQKVSRAMIAATLTAGLSFAPLLFVSGVLGSFIKAIPITIISALAISLLFALLFIPLLARFILLGRKQMGEKGVQEIAAGIEHRIAQAIAKPMLWAKGSTKKLLSVGTMALLVGFVFIGMGAFVATKVSFNIFPASKDANDIQVTLAFAPGTTITEAEAIADTASDVVARELGENFERASYFGAANERSAALRVKLISYGSRDVSSRDLINQLESAFDEFTAAQVSVTQVDVGPPASPFVVRVTAAENRDAAVRLAADVATFLETLEVTRLSGETARVQEVGVANPGVVSRSNGTENLNVSAEFDAADVSALYPLAEAAVLEEFTPENVASYGLPRDALGFDTGQESENQESFQTLVYALPAVLFVIYILLAVQFRSLLQPLLIFMAIPFSFFGISLSLYLTDNPFSFFAMLGFFALIGLSIKNSILLTDAANQARRTGLGPVDAIVTALGERFRPLVATSLTAVVSLVPLSIISPFWQGLAILIIFGLLSSTFLVLTVFPYYYLGAEYLRIQTARLFRRRRVAR